MRYTLITLFFVASAWCSLTYASGANSEVVPAEDIKWGYLNPLRGKLSPGAADLWGNRTTDNATGMLVRFNKGFASPPHIHNITYRGVVIKGLLHNDDPGAEKMWMPKGSFWTQPAGEEHITAANGETNLIYLEIDSGPYLVRPSKEQFDNGERPLNLHEMNVVWLSEKDDQRIKGEGVKIVSLWGSSSPDKLGGYMLKLPTGYKGQLESRSQEFRAVLVQGVLSYQSEELDGTKVLKEGSYFGSTGKFEHQVSVIGEKEVILYVRSNSHFTLN